MLQGAEMKALQKSLMTVGHDLEKSTWSSGWTNHGFEEKIANKDVMSLAKDLYAVKEALKKFCDSELVQANNKLGMATLKDKHFKKMEAMLFKDMHVKSWEGLKQKMDKMEHKFGEKIEDAFRHDMGL